jgi:hypothetical protein
MAAAAEDGTNALPPKVWPALNVPPPLIVLLPLCSPSVSTGMEVEVLVPALDDSEVSGAGGGGGEGEGDGAGAAAAEEEEGGAGAAADVGMGECCAWFWL